MRWVNSTQNLVSTAPPSIAHTVGADARNNEVAFYPKSPTIVDLACVSASGNSFGIQIDMVDPTRTGYVKLKVIDGTATVGWYLGRYFSAGRDLILRLRLTGHRTGLPFSFPAFGLPCASSICDLVTIG